MHNFKQFRVWQKSRELVKSVYHATAEFPESERFGLVSQIRRAVISIPTNIAEGCGRGTDKSLAHFLSIARSSAFETESLLILCEDLQCLSEGESAELREKVQEIQKMLFRLINKFSNDNSVAEPDVDYGIQRLN